MRSAASHNGALWLPRTVFTNISTAIQAADAQTILNAASARMLRVSFGVM